MKENIKAALLSALVLPGAGQIYRGRRLKGAILVIAVTFLLIVGFILVVMAVQDALQGSGSPSGMDPVALAERLRGWLPAMLWLGGAFLCLWVYGVADALLGTGKKNGTRDGA